MSGDLRNRRRVAEQRRRPRLAMLTTVPGVQAKQVVEVVELSL